MRRSSAAEEEAFLQAEARELAMLADEQIGRRADSRKPVSVLHTLSVELSVLLGLGDSPRMEWLIAEASRLLASQGKQDAVVVLHDTLGRLQRAAAR